MASKRERRRAAAHPPLVSGTDLVSAKVIQLIGTASSEIQQRAATVRRELSTDLQERFGSASLQGDPACEALASYSSYLVERVAATIRKHSSLFWIMLQRRIPMAAQRFALVIEALMSAVKERMFEEHQRTLTGLFFKCGSEQMQDWCIGGDGTLMIDPHTDDVVSLLCDVSICAAEMGGVATAYRRAAKGASLFISHEGMAATSCDPDLEFEMHLYDARRSAFTATFSHVSSLTTLRGKESHNLRGAETDPSTFVYLRPFYCAEDALPKSRAVPNYVPMVCDQLQDAVDLLGMFNRKVKEITGLSAQEVQYLMWALKRHLIRELDTPLGRHTVLMRGASFYSRGRKLQEMLASRLQELQSAGYPIVGIEDLSGKALKWLTNTASDLRSFDALLPFYLKPVFDMKRYAVLDLSMVGSALEGVLANVQLEGNLKTIRATALEAEVAQLLKRDIPDLEFVWKPGLFLKLDKNLTLAQGDVYLRKDSTLIIVDCKAWLLTHNYFKGTPSAVRARWGEVEAWLRETDARARKVAQHPEGRNYRVPPGVSYVLGVVCSAFPEFIWTREEKFFLTEEIPRVCTYKELLRFLRSFDQGTIARKPYCYPVCDRPGHDKRPVIS